jgi:hypothetical protein
MRTLKFRLPSNDFPDFIWIFCQIFCEFNKEDIKNVMYATYNLCLIDYDFYKRLSKLELFISIANYCLEQLENRGLIYQKFIEFVKVFDVKHKSIVKNSRHILKLKMDIEKEDNLKYIN